MAMTDYEETLLRRFLIYAAPVIQPITETNWSDPRDIVEKGNKSLDAATAPLTPFPDNPKRAERCQQLVTLIATMQSEAVAAADAITKDISLRPALEKLVADGKIPALETLKTQALASIPVADRQNLEGLIHTVREFNDDTSYVLQVSLFISTIYPGGLAVGSLISGIKSIVTSRFISKIASSFKSGATSTELVAIGIETEIAAAIEMQAEIREVVAVTQEVSRIARIARVIGRVARFLGNIGIGIMVIDMVMQVVVGQLQTEKLVEGIHQAQVARLLVYYIRKEVWAQKTQRLNILLYLNALDSGKMVVANSLRDDLIKEMGGGQDCADCETKYTSLEAELASMDAINTGGYYSTDDLMHDQVVKLALSHHT